MRAFLSVRAGDQNSANLMLPLQQRRRGGSCIPAEVLPGRHRCVWSGRQRRTKRSKSKPRPSSRSTDGGSTAASSAVWLGCWAWDHVRWWTGVRTPAARGSLARIGTVTRRPPLAPRSVLVGGITQLTTTAARSGGGSGRLAPADGQAGSASCFGAQLGSRAATPSLLGLAS